MIGLNIHFGFTGLLNMGQAGFMLLGAYGFAISIDKGIPLGLAVLIGIAAAVVFALILGMPTLKLRGDYLAIVTISAAEIIRYTGRLATLENFTGAAQGLPGSQFRGPFVALSFFPGGGVEWDPFHFLGLSGDRVGVELPGHRGQWLVGAVRGVGVGGDRDGGGVLHGPVPVGAVAAGDPGGRGRDPVAWARTCSRSRCRRW